MKQTAVDFAVEQLSKEHPIYTKNDIIKEAKEIENQQKDDYAIEFGMFLRKKCLIDDNYIYWWYYGIKYTEKQLLEIFKKELGL